jgi:hypothetical protein
MLRTIIKILKETFVENGVIKFCVITQLPVSIKI